MKHKELLRRVVEISYKMRLSHMGSNMSALPIIADIYEQKKPDEKVVISNGHAHLAHLVVMESQNKDNALLIPERANDGKYTGFHESLEYMIDKYGVHCDRRAGCDASTGSLGHGIGIAVGMALADRSKNVYCLISDGEMAEGSVWEALRVANEYGLTNLKVSINCNGWGAYRNIDRQSLAFHCLAFANIGISFIDTSRAGLFGWLQTQEAHYKVMNESEYLELMEVLK